MNNLILDFYKKEYPYKEEPFDNKIIWGVIELKILSEDRTKVVKNVFKLEWDLRVLILWGLENKQNIFNETVPFVISDNNDSIAKQIHTFYQKNDFEDEILMDRVFEYRRSHGLRFALRGTDIPEIYIGKSGDNIEISFFEKNGEWRYYINPLTFFECIESMRSEYVKV